MWKITQHTVPNIDGTVGYKIENIQDVEQCAIQYPTTRKKIKNCFGASVVQLVAKISRDTESVKTEKFKFELDNFLELLVSPKCPTM